MRNTVFNNVTAKMKLLVLLVYIGLSHSQDMATTLDHCPSGSTENLVTDVIRVPDSAVKSSTTTAVIRAGGAWIAERLRGRRPPSLTVYLTQTPANGGVLVTQIRLVSNAKVGIEYKSPVTNDQFVLLSNGLWNHRHEFRLNKDTEMTAIRLSLLRPMNSGQTHYHAYGLRITGCDKQVIEAAVEPAPGGTREVEDIEW